MSDYSGRAEYWDCFFGDRSEEIKFWAQMANRFGRKILAPMAATGEVAAALASDGLEVVAIDSCQEMVQLGQRSRAAATSLRFVQADVITLSLDTHDFDFAFFATGDFQHFVARADQSAVLRAIRGHLRSQGGLALDLYHRPPNRRSGSSRTRWRFPSIRPPADPDVRVWKESRTRFDEDDRLLRIYQTQFVESGGATKEHSYEICLHVFDRDEITGLLDDCGFRVAAEYGTHAFDPWTEESPKWVVLAERT